MKLTACLPLAALTLLFAGCITEPAPEDTTQFGHIDKPHRQKKAPKVKPVTTEEEAIPEAPAQ